MPNLLTGLVSRSDAIRCCGRTLSSQHTGALGPIRCSAARMPASDSISHYVIYGINECAATHPTVVPRQRARDADSVPFPVVRGRPTAEPRHRSIGSRAAATPWPFAPRAPTLADRPRSHAETRAGTARPSVAAPSPPPPGRPRRVRPRPPRVQLTAPQPHAVVHRPRTHREKQRYADPRRDEATAPSTTDRAGGRAGIERQAAKSRRVAASWHGTRRR
jgi:hypothetical protein